MTATRLLKFFKEFSKYHDCRYTSLAAEHGLSMREVDVLLFLANNPGYDTARDITEYRGLSKSQVSQAVDLLAAEGFLLRTPDAADRRIIHLSITEEGLPMAMQAQVIQASCGQQLLAGLTPEQGDLLHSILETVLDNASRLAEEAML